ncbi:MAG: flagellar biosynthetic protein FliO [Holosporaceae bacterium]|jgi:flagellar protein FliO/FliZ|nr:FliO/MopB family protein [Rhodospirillaceae bacterium]
METISFTRLLLAWGVLLASLYALWWGLRRWGGLLGAIRPTNNPKRRLQLLESQALDPKRRLVLVRHDNTEYLLLLGANHEVVLQHEASAVTLAGAGADITVHPANQSEGSA